MSESGEWVSLRGAAEILGVHPATVRNWADRGDLPSRRTPGGHRRFRKTDLLHYAQSQPSEVQPSEVQIIIQNALGQTRMQVDDSPLARAAWYAAMRDATRDHLRQQGRRVLEALRVYLANNGQDSDLAAAVTLGKDYGVRLIADGLTLPQAVRGFFYYSDFVTNAVLTWSEVAQPHSAADWGHLLRQVNTFIHTMLLSLIEYYQED
ncbi:MAG: helix-turn-helix domain-containing protein [Chloroflexi bacterium]|nr:helix-turn-helix domain-containing protein [Chloroflexota bacterium]